MTMKVGIISPQRQLSAAVALLFAAGSWQTAAAVGQPSAGKAVRGGTSSSSRPVCEQGYHLRGSQGRGFSCSRPGRRNTKPRCRGHYGLRIHRRGFICVPRRTATPTAPSGSITNVLAVGGRIQATYTTSFNISAWFPAADQLPASQACRYDTSHLTYLGSVRAFGTEAGTTTFSPAYTGSIRICLYAYYTPQAYLVAETTFTPATPPPPIRPATPPPPTPPPAVRHVETTVANICSANPDLGVVRKPDPTVLAVTGFEGFSWDVNGDGELDFGALDFEGDNAVDVAFVFVKENGVEEAWLGFCAPHETPWINLQRFEQELQQSHPSYPTVRASYFINTGGLNPWVSSAPDLGPIANGEFFYNHGECGLIASDCGLDGYTPL
jgi:hypothetical protein